MGYKLLQFNLGTGQAQGYVLQGDGEHEGTNENISVQDMQAAVDRAYAVAREQGWKLPEFTFLLDSPKREGDPRIGREVAAFLDYRFLRAHGERIARDMGYIAERAAE